MKKIKALLLSPFFLLFSSSTSTISYTEICVSRAKEMVEQKDVYILDVRSAAEYDEGHIENAINIPLGDIEDSLETLPKDKTNRILVYCHGGMKSASASRKLVNLGYTNVYNMGAITNWSSSGYSLIS